MPLQYGKRQRYDVERMRVTRGEVRRWPNTGDMALSDIIDGVVPGGSIYHILGVIPEDTGLELAILIDGATILHFELPWLREKGFLGRSKNSYRVGGPPCEVQFWTLDEYHRAIGQGKYRILIDHAVADARRIVKSNQS